MNPVVRFGISAISTVALVGGMATPAFAAAGSFVKSNFAGYEATAATGFTTFEGTLTVPTLACASSPYSVLSPSVSVIDESTRDSATANFTASCVAGTAYYSNSSVQIIAGSHFSEAATDTTAGDVLKFSGRENTKGTAYTMTITNTTTGFSASASAPMSPSFTAITAATHLYCNSGCSGGSGVQAPIPSFTPITYGHLTFGGARLGSLNPTGYEMYDATSLQVSTSKVSTVGTFDTKWVASS
jgi:hypothetical protein